MIVCIAEKPSVGRDIAHVLGANQQRDGYMEGNGYQVTWTFGHLCELKEPHEYSPLWKTWSLAQLPMIPQRFGIKLKTDKGVEKQFNTIKKLMLGAERIINCGDAGQEGELIQRWVIQMTGAKCPVQRLWISSLTEEAIREGFEKLKDQSEYQSLYEAGLSRAIGDWTLGMNATRLYTLKYRNRLIEGNVAAPVAKGGKKPVATKSENRVLSIGRVQTPTLALIVRRQQEIENFVPVPYWVLTTKYRDVVFSYCPKTDKQDKADEADTADTSPSAGARGASFATREEGEAALEKIRELPFTVTKVEKKKGTEAPPRLFDLTSLQVECNKKYGFSADLTLQLIHSLYEKKYTTYPRVDTTFLPDDVYPKCPQIMNGLRNYFHLMERIKGKKLPKSKKVFDNKKVTDHHAIIPTGVYAQAMTELEAKVYDLIVRRFIGAFYPDCLFDTTNVFGEVGDIQFKATGKHITDPGWKVVWEKNGGEGSVDGGARNASDFKQGEQEEDASSLQSPLSNLHEEGALPAFVKGESGPHEPNLAEKQTTPPKPYTEATLLRAMETAGRFVENEELRDALKENGIGRPSTRAAIIETLFRRQYIRKERKALWATPTGVELISLIHEELLKSAELTGIWERKLRQIERREYEAKQFIDELKQMVTELVLSVMADNRMSSEQ